MFGGVPPSPTATWCDYSVFSLLISPTLYRSTIAGSCKNNFQIKKWKNSETMNPIKWISEKLYRGKTKRWNIWTLLSSNHINAP